ncbi:MAG: UDP-3-O-(3-hydroxymyristoyl)glucosamine N-acyltransferase [Gammaproteobacteria bacterium]|nr:UDP-3-O-(3-hydroxymyristoyl)glucosamine N-acyltransferase [Gammaproteobacteria bacterium]
MAELQAGQNSYKLAQLAEQVGAECVGDSSLNLSGVNTLQDGGAGEIGFLSNPKYRDQLGATALSAVVVSPKDADTLVELGKPGLIHANPYAAFAKIAALFDQTPPAAEGISDAADIHPDATVDPQAHVAAGAQVRAGALVAAGAQIGANSVVGVDAQIGENTVLEANVTVYHQVKIGAYCRVHSGTVIGADGFGWAPEDGDWVKVPQLGSVVIEDHVDIGANCCIDRGTLGDTVIETGVKLDNHIQVAHNVRIGAYTVMAAQTAIAGSATVGKHVIAGGNVGIAGHISVADGSMLTARTMVLNTIEERGSYSGGIPQLTTPQWRRSMARLRQLDDTNKKLAKLEKQLAALQSKLAEDE